MEKEIGKVEISKNISITTESIEDAIESLKDNTIELFDIINITIYIKKDC